MYNNEDYGPSKTSLKKDADKAQSLGLALLNFNEAFLKTLELDENLFEAIILAKNIRQKGGKRRQIQLIGKLMRRADIETIETAINQIHAAKTNDRQTHHRAECRRDALISANANERGRLLEALDLQDNKEISRLLKATSHYEAGSLAYKKASRNLFRALLTVVS